MVDGKTLTHDPFDPAAPEESASIPLLIGTVEEEVNFFPTTPLDPIDDADLHKRVKQSTRADDATVDHLIATYKKGRPNKSNVEIYQIIATDSGFSAGVHTEADRKAAQGKAPGLQVLLHLAVAGARWQTALLPHARNSVRAGECGQRKIHDRHGSGPLRAVRTR